MKIYLIPGLGFDDRIFRNLDLAQFDLEYINWIEPEKAESIKHYASRMAEKIKIDRAQTILIGHSLGGIISQEIAAFKQIEKIILISSIRSQKENPLKFRIVKPFGIHKLFTKQLTHKTLKFWGKSQDYQTDNEQDLFKDMVSKHTNNYLQWALRELSVWKSPKIPSSTKLFQIHGEFDKTFPLKLIKNPDKVIKNAGHFMVYKFPNKINEIIINELTYP